jgi:hypothetical protein
LERKFYLVSGPSNILTQRIMEVWKLGEITVNGKERFLQKDMAREHVSAGNWIVDPWRLLLWKFQNRRHGRVTFYQSSQNDFMHARIIL